MRLFSPFHVGKQVIQSFILTNRDYFNVLFINILQYKKKLLQKWWRIKTKLFACRGDNMYEYCQASVQRTTRSKVSIPVETQMQNHHTKFKKEIVPRKQYRIWKFPYLKKTIRKFLITYSMKFIQKNHFQRSKTNYRQFAWIKVCLEIPLSEDSYRLVDTGL